MRFAAIDSDPKRGNDAFSLSGEFVLDRLSAEMRARGRISLVTDLSPAHVCDGSLEPAALRSLYDAVPSAGLWHVPRLHAKVYVADSSHAIVTSGNLTAGGLFRNLEFGVGILDQRHVQGILSTFDLYRATGVGVSRDQLVKFEVEAARVRSAFQSQQGSVSQDATSAFRQILQEAEDDLLRLRLAGGAVHAVFGRSIAYLLERNGPMPTIEIHRLIQELHPDLCDDAVDRVIDGQSFGKKWKHAVRTAQQVLKQKGAVSYKDGLWSSIP